MMDAMELEYKYGELTDLRKQMEQVWAKDTAYKNMWNPKIPSTGHCFVTALWLNWYFGGDIIRGRVEGESHYWNIINDIPVALTSDQFGGDGYNPVGEGRKCTHAVLWGNERYLLFKERMSNVKDCNRNL